MADKKIYTREEFEKLRLECAQKMSEDAQLRKKALELLYKADQYNWIHQTSWMGEPILNLPQDMFALQEIIFKTRPKFVIEVGVAWGGSLLFYSSLMEIFGGEKVVGVDIYIPEDLKSRLAAHGKISDRINLVEGSSIDEKTVDQIKSITGDSKEVMVILDSNHTHEHVLKELQLYSQLIGKGYYLICGDTIIEDIPEQLHRDRPWGPGNNPKTALHEFLKGTDRFQTDKEIENKLLFTCNPEGYLVCCKD